MSLPKTTEKCRRPRNQSNYIGLDESYPKIQVLSNLSNFVKSYGHLSEVLVFFTKSTHQIWLDHVTSDANFENL